MKKNVLVIKGGGASEHEISLISSKYIEEKIDRKLFEVFPVEIDKNFKWKYDGLECELNFNKELIFKDSKIKIDAVIPCLHGFPGETGNIQSYFELIGLSYFGCNPESSLLCFNKLATKLFLESIGIKTTPYIQLQNEEDTESAATFIKANGTCFLKATNQGSSVGCYQIQSFEDLKKNIKDAFTHSPFVILEKAIDGRELEVSAFEYNNEIIITAPGEIECESDFYSYEEKYSNESKTKTITQATGISEDLLKEINRQATLAFKALKLRHLSRIDFFLSSNDEVFINEINTFPGHTSISMFPLMMEASGVKYSDFLNQHLENLTH